MSGNRRRWARTTGWLAITAGLLVLLSRILPVGFWWTMLGISLIAVGVCLERNCC